MAPQTPDGWTVACAGQEPGSRCWSSGYDSFISLFRSPPNSSPCVPQTVPARNGLAFHGPTPLKGAQTKENCPHAPRLPQWQLCRLVSGAGQGITSRKGPLGPRGHRTPAGRTTASLLQAHWPIPEPTCPRTVPELPRRWPWASSPQRPAGAPLLRNASLSVHTGDSCQSGHQGDGSVQAPDGSQLSLAKIPEDHVESLGHSWLLSRARCHVCSPGPLPPGPGLSPRGRRRESKGQGYGPLGQLCAPQAPAGEAQTVWCSWAGPQGSRQHGSSRGPHPGGPARSLSHAHEHTDTHTHVPRTGGHWIHCFPGERGGGPGEGPGPHVWARESSSRPPFPSRYLARSFLVTSPTTCGNRAGSGGQAAASCHCGNSAPGPGGRHRLGEPWNWARGQSGSRTLSPRRADSKSTHPRPL